jgi:hypothetical protein
MGVIYKRAQRRKYKEINGRKDYIKHILHIISNIKWNFKCTICKFLFIVLGTQQLNVLQKMYIKILRQNTSACFKQTCYI